MPVRAFCKYFAAIPNAHISASGAAMSTVPQQNIPQNLLDLVLFSQREVKPVAMRFRDLTAEEYWHLAWPFLLPLIGGLLLRYAASLICFPYWLPKDFVSALADALAVAGVLGLLFEIFATRLIVQKISDDLTGKLVGSRFPPQLQTHIGAILKTDVVRDNYKKVYRLSAITDSDKLKIDVTVTFEVRNYSDLTIEYSPFFQDEAIYDPQLVSLEYGIIGQPFHVSVSEENNAVTKVKTVRGSKSIKLEPVLRNVNAIGEVVMRYTLNMPRDYVDITDFAAATLGATIRVEDVPGELEVVSFGADNEAIHVNGGKSWRFKGPFIAGQHIRIWWFPRKTPSAMMGA
jgi:hypothetical protein